MTEGKVTGKSRSTTGKGTGLDISKLGSNGARLVPASGSVFMLGSGGRRWHLLAPFFLQKSTSSPCLSGTESKFSK